MTSDVTRRAVMLGSVGAAGTAALAGCSGKEAAGEDLPLRIHANDSTTFQPNFNPYGGVPLQGASGLIYENLRLATAMAPGESEPWLATEMSWSEDGTELTLTRRDDVRFVDGEPLDADDVAYTFLMHRDVPATNTVALDVVDASVVDPTTVRIEFGSTSFAQESDICTRPIVPEHVFSTFENPSMEQIAEPMGSGPYRLERFSDQLYTFVKNDDHWAADEFEPRELAFPSFTTQTMNTALQAGEIDWSGGFIANIDKIFVDHDPANRGYWYPGNGTVNLTMNLEKELFQDLELRRGISLAVDRQEIAEIAYMKYFGPPHPTGLPRPTYEEFIAEEYRDLEFEVDVAGAEKVLDDAGYARGEDGIRVAPDGTPLVFDLPIPSSYNDWVTTSQILGSQLRKIGITLTPRGISFEQWLEARDTGNFDITISTAGAGQNPWYLYRSMLSSEYRTEGDEPVVANFQRWYDDETDELLRTFADTDDEEGQRAAVEGLQRIMVEQLPTLPIITAPNWFNYNTEVWTGFPNEDDPYALGAPVQNADRVMVLRNLTRTTT
ncbi:ABC transporter substrate-binding protein [Brachybacterium tyrofermentans]|uniref:ABC transporter substrate-binding protein n=1 Tax=Brachybacterium tyrofermentans TaxID=47848 RepID=UPI003FCFB9DF